jgi:hypothetical protein
MKGISRCQQNNLKMIVGLKSCQSDWSGRSGVSKRLVSRKHGIEVLSVKFGQLKIVLQGILQSFWSVWEVKQMKKIVQKVNVIVILELIHQ